MNFFLTMTDTTRIKNWPLPLNHPVYSSFFPSPSFLSTKQRTPLLIWVPPLPNSDANSRIFVCLQFGSVLTRWKSCWTRTPIRRCSPGCSRVTWRSPTKCTSSGESGWGGRSCPTGSGSTTRCLTSSVRYTVRYGSYPTAIGCST